MAEDDEHRQHEFEHLRDLIEETCGHVIERVYMRIVHSKDNMSPTELKTLMNSLEKAWFLRASRLMQMSGEEFQKMQDMMDGMEDEEEGGEGDTLGSEDEPRGKSNPFGEE